MSKVLILYDSKTGNTGKMAKAVSEGVEKSGVNVNLQSVGECNYPEDLKRADGIILGSPTYFGTMSNRMKELIDKSVDIRGDLEDKIGAAFVSSGSISGGNETTLFSLIQAMLIHGMIVIGDPLDATGHYGIVSIGSPNEETLELCRKLGERMGRLVKDIS